MFNQSVVVLSLVPPDDYDDTWHIAALKIKEGLYPKYFFICSGEDSLRSYQTKINEFIGSADLFLFEENNIDRAIFQKLGLTPYSIYSVKEVAMIVFPLAGKYQLEELAKRLNIKLKNHNHTLAHHNTRLTWEVLKLCFEKTLKMELTFITKIIEYTEGLKSQSFFQKLGNLIVKKYPDRPIRTDHSFGKSTKNIFDRCKEESSEQFPILKEWVESCFEAEGLLSKSFPSFEYRFIQTKMAKTLLTGFAEAEDIIIEAGTGTGKTIAYLIPSLWWAKKTGEKVIIATHTITLQEQIFFKDLPSLAGILPFKFNRALLKGRSNYICLKSFKEQKSNIQNLSTKERLERAITLSWLEETDTGDFGELTQINIYDLTKRFGCDNRLCQPGDCRYRKSCYYLEARRRAEEADLVVINHSLLLADIKTKNRVLPEYHNLIVDEAHNLYPTALRQLGFELCLEQMIRLIDMLQGDDKASLLSSLRKYYIMWSQAYPDSKLDIIDKTLEDIPASAINIVEQTQELFKMVDSILGGKTNLLLDEDSLDQYTLEYFFLAIENLLNRLANLNSILDKITSSLLADSEQFDNIKHEIIKFKSDLAVIIDGLSGIPDKEGEYQITYLEKTNTVYIKSCPFDVAPILKEEIFSKNNCTALISATLSVADSFTYIAQDVGIESYNSLKLDSTFNYDEQMLFCIVNDLFDRQNEETLVTKTASFIKEISEIMQGRTLVLFTSHRILRLVHYQLQKEWESHDFEVLSQGINGNRDIILKEFMQRERCVLMGTNTFWEGIDIPGDNLRCVVMVKLPFPSPETPIIKAKSSLLKKHGGDPFNELLLPEAVIRFKQGFGRLIRTKDDQGVVVLLDDRVIKKSYGKSFIKSLPITSYFKGDDKMVLSEVSKWI